MQEIEKELKREEIIQSVVDCAHEKKKIPSTWDYDGCDCKVLTCKNALEYFDDWKSVIEASPLPTEEKKSPEWIRKFRYDEWITNGKPDCSDC